MATFEGIVDIYEENAFDFDAAWNAGIRAILHETSRGTFHKDSKYAERKKVALKKGFLWAAFHLLSDEDIGRQLDVFLSMEDGSDPNIGLALDWEEPKGGQATMTYPHLRAMVRAFNSRMKPHYPDRYPILYGGHLMREQAELTAGDALLAKCPLWYQRYRDTPLGLPVNTWPRYSLWQFDDENRANGAPKTLLPGADWNRFDGTFEELKQAWPFSSGGENVKKEHSMSAFTDQIRMIAQQEWQWWGSQAYDVSGHATKIGHKEMEEGFYQKIGVYCVDGANVHGEDGRDRDFPWSAVFISWVMKQGGAGDRFRYSSQHSVYISQAIRDLLSGRDAAGFWGYRLNEMKPSVGDLVCWSRQDGIDYDHQNHGNYAGHTDIVVSVSAGSIDIIGGNVGNSVTRRTLALNEQGFLPPLNNGEALFALMKNRI